MEQYSITKTVSDKLKDFSIGNFDDLKPSMQSHLISIEEYFQKCNEEFRKIKLQLDKIDLNTRGICNGANISKSTIYNYPDILLKYIDNRKEELDCNKEFINSERLKALEEEIEKQKVIIDKLIIDNIDYMNQKILIENLKKENERLLKQRDTLGREKAALNKRNNEMSIELKKVRNNLIEFPSK